MADFELSVAEEAFNSLGVKIKFNENLYGELLDEFIPPDQATVPSFAIREYFDAEPTELLLHEETARRQTSYDLLRVKIRPHVLWGKNILQRAAFALKPLEQKSYGNFNAQAGLGNIEVECRPAEPLTNTSLLHETKHFIDYCHGMDKTWHETFFQKRKSLYAAWSIGNLAAGLYLSAKVHPQLLPATIYSAPLGIAGINYLGYYRDPKEVSARQFADDPDIVDAYGHVITYEQT